MTSGSAESGGAARVLRVRAAGGAAGGAAGRAAAVAPLEVASTRRARERGLLGRDGIEGALLLSPARGVHTLGMRFAIDVAFLDRELRVVAVRTMRPGRLGLPRPSARHVLEAEAGAMARWGLEPGTRVEFGT